MDTAEVNSYIGERIKNLRNRNGLTQQELADRTELTKGFISQLSLRTGQACFLCCVCAWLRRKHLDVREPV